MAGKPPGRAEETQDQQQIVELFLFGKQGTGQKEGKLPGQRLFTGPVFRLKGCHLAGLLAEHHGMGQGPDPQVPGLGQNLRAPDPDVFTNSLGVGGKVKIFPGHRGGGDGTRAVVIVVDWLRQQGDFVRL